MKKTTILILAVIFITGCKTPKPTYGYREKMIFRFTDSAVIAFERGDTIASAYWFKVALNVDSVISKNKQ